MGRRPSGHPQKSPSRSREQRPVFNPVRKEDRPREARPTHQDVSGCGRLDRGGEDKRHCGGSDESQGSGHGTTLIENPRACGGFP
jgi:hypothetical protein